MSPAHGDAGDPKDRLTDALRELSTPLFDGFLSHADDDTAEATLIHEALTARGLDIFFDKSRPHGIDFSNIVPDRVNLGLSRSRGGIILMTPTYLHKYITKSGYAYAECNALLNLVASRAELTLIAIRSGVTYDELLRANPLLAMRLNPDLNDQGLEAIAELIERVFRPPSPSAVAGQVVMSQSISAGAHIADNSAPSDALPEFAHNETMKPTLEILVSSPSSTDNQPGTLEYLVANRGPGSAFRVALSLPAAAAPIRVATEIPNRSDILGSVLLQSPPSQDIRSKLQAISECEDEAGNIYRQYSNVEVALADETHVAAYHVGPFGFAHMVAQRIVHV